MSKPLVLGAVAYDPKVVTIWEGFRAWFARRGLALDYVLFSNYERQVAALLAQRLDVAWNSPLAWIESEELAKRAGRTARAIAMRDTDQDLTSVIAVREDSGIASLADLRGLRIATGATDSPQGTLLPLALLQEAGLVPGRDVDVMKFEVGVGLHGDHVGGERDAARALAEGRADAACMLDANHLLFAREGLGRMRVIAQTQPFDHCNFTALEGSREDELADFRTILLAMSHDDPETRPLMDLEGLRAWRPGRTAGYEPLRRALALQDALGGFLAATGACA